MKNFKNKVAVITGAANGIGKALAFEAAQRGMKVVITDVDEQNLKQVESDIIAMGAEALAVVSDATDYQDVVNLAEVVTAKFGQVDLLVNNVGAAVQGAVWDIPLKDMDYVIDTNQKSILYHLKVFVPMMLKQDTDCHILNVASIAGLFSSPGMPTYHMSKHAAVGLSEAVCYQLQEMGSKIKMSVFCPGYTQTDFHNNDQRRPAKYALDDDPYYSSAEYLAGQQLSNYVITTGMPIDSISMTVFQGIEDGDFYILTHPVYNPIIEARMQTILNGQPLDVNFFKNLG